MHYCLKSCYALHDYNAEWERTGGGCQGGRNMYSDNFLKGQFLFIVIQDHVQKSLQQLRFHKGIYLQVRQYKEKVKGTRFLKVSSSNSPEQSPFWLPRKLNILDYVSAQSSEEGNGSSECYYCLDKDLEL